MASYQGRNFRGAVDRFVVRVKTKADIAHEAIVAQTFTSIVFGSEVTGAPGQPVGPDEPPHEHLRESWQVDRVSENVARIFTTSPYAKSNEDGIARPGGGEYRLLSPVGGRFSVRLTVAGFRRIVEKVMRELGSGGGNTSIASLRTSGGPGV